MENINTEAISVTEVIPNSPASPQQHNEVQNESLQNFITNMSSQTQLCHLEHIRHCDCQREGVEKKTVEIFREYKKELENPSPMLLESNRVAAVRKAREVVAEECLKNGVRCPYEEKVIVDTVVTLCGRNNELYDICNPNVAMIVKSVVSQSLTMHRVSVYSSKNGLVEAISDRDGNLRYFLSPVEDLKMKYDKLLIESIEKLNNIVFGSKQTTFNVHTASDDVDLKSFLKSLRSHH